MDDDVSRQRPGDQNDLPAVLNGNDTGVECAGRVPQVGVFGTEPESAVESRIDHQHLTGGIPDGDLERESENRSTGNCDIRYVPSAPTVIVRENPRSALLTVMVSPASARPAMAPAVFDCACTPPAMHSPSAIASAPRRIVRVVFLLIRHVLRKG